MQRTRDIYNKVIMPLPDADKLELASLILQRLATSKSEKRISAADVLRQLPKREYRSVQEVNESLQEERDSWDN